MGWRQEQKAEETLKQKSDKDKVNSIYDHICLRNFPCGYLGSMCFICNTYIPMCTSKNTNSFLVSIVQGVKVNLDILDGNIRVNFSK